MPLEYVDIRIHPGIILKKRRGSVEMEMQRQTEPQRGMGRPLEISVIIPVYNERQTIAEVVRRVQEQPFAKEIIIVDDCSKDGTRDLLQQTARSEEHTSELQ